MLLWSHYGAMYIGCEHIKQLDLKKNAQILYSKLGTNYSVKTKILEGKE